MNDPKAVVILIDNSATSIDGDFYPTRLMAQKLTAERYAQYIFSRNRNSQIAIGTIGNVESGIRASFSGSISKIREVLDNITSNGYINLQKGIRCAVLALRHCNQVNDSYEINKRILAFVGDRHDITSQSALQLAQLLSKEKVRLDLVTMGQNVPKKDVLKELVKFIAVEYNSDAPSRYLDIPFSRTMLSDDVLSSDIGPGAYTMPPANDPDIQEVINLSQNESMLRETTNSKNQSISMLLQNTDNAAAINKKTKNSRNKASEKQAVSIKRQPPRPKNNNASKDSKKREKPDQK